MMDLSGCLHCCHVCTTLFCHEPRCESFVDVPICSTCQHDGWEQGYCGKCKETQPILKGQMLCDECMQPHVRTA
jgi:hypothetical protein